MKNRELVTENLFQKLKKHDDDIRNQYKKQK